MLDGTLSKSLNKMHKKTNERLVDYVYEKYLNKETYKNKMDSINHPKHYNQLPIECIDVVKHFDFIIGNVIKYCWRAGLKNSDTELDDLKKAKFYIEYKIKMLEDECIKKQD